MKNTKSSPTAVKKRKSPEQSPPLTTTTTTNEDKDEARSESTRSPVSTSDENKSMKIARQDRADNEPVEESIPTAASTSSAPETTEQASTNGGEKSNEVEKSNGRNEEMTTNSEDKHEATGSETNEMADEQGKNSKRGKSVRFANVRIFEFMRCQGFSSIPGNFAPFNETITLGKTNISFNHFYFNHVYIFLFIS